jgi:hypothetical protein
MSMVTIEEVVPLSGRGTDAVMTAVKKILNRGDVTALTVTAGDDVIRFSRVATQEEAEAKQDLSYHDVVRANKMEEYVPDSQDVDPHRQMFEMFEIIDDAGFVPIILLSGCPLHKLRDWLDLMSRKAKAVYGVRVLVDENIPDDCLILCGSETNDSDGPESVRFSVKVALP